MRWRKDRKRSSSYRSPQEIALQNAADSLGVDLGDYYPDDPSLTDGPPEALERNDRVDASREELLAYIGGRGAKRRQRRTRMLRITAGGLLVVGAVALATNALRVESPPPSRSEGDRWKDLSGGLSRLPPSARSGRGFPGPVAPVSTGFSAGHHEIIHTAYVDQYGDVCPTTWTLGDGATLQRSSGGCWRVAEIARRLSREPAVLQGTSGGDTYFQMQGFARSDLRRIAVRGYTKDVRVAISPPWTPGEGAQSRGIQIKTFLIRIPFDLKFDPLAGVRALQEHSLKVVGELVDGRVFPLEPIGETNKSRAPLDPVT